MYQSGSAKRDISTAGTRKQAKINRKGKNPKVKFIQTQGKSWTPTPLTTTKTNNAGTSRVNGSFKTRT